MSNEGWLCKHGEPLDCDACAIGAAQPIAVETPSELSARITVSAGYPHDGSRACVCAKCNQARGASAIVSSHCARCADYRGQLDRAADNYRLARAELEVALRKLAQVEAELRMRRLP